MACGGVPFPGVVGLVVVDPAGDVGVVVPGSDEVGDVVSVDFGCVEGCVMSPAEPCDCIGLDC